MAKAKRGSSLDAEYREYVKSTPTMRVKRIYMQERREYLAELAKERKAKRK